MTERRAFNKSWADDIGMDLSTFFIDTKAVHHGGYSELSNHIEDRIQRCFVVQGRLIAKLVDLGVLTVDDAIEVTDVDKSSLNYEIRKVKD